MTHQMSISSKCILHTLLNKESRELTVYQSKGHTQTNLFIYDLMTFVVADTDLKLRVTKTRL